MKRFRHFLGFTLFLIGSALFLFVIKSVGLSQLKVFLSALSGPSWLAFAIYPFMCVWDVLAWRKVFVKEWRKKIKFFDLFCIRLAGEAVNNITPILDIGGEPLKVVLVSKRFDIPKRSALSASVIDRTALFVAEILFILLGLALSFFILPLSWEWKIGFTLTVLVFILFAVFFIFAQKKGLFVTFIQWLDVFQFDPKLFERFHISFKQVDEEISSFYSREKRSFQQAVWLHTLGWIAGGVEMYIFFRIVGIPMSLPNAMMIEALLQLVRTISFFIPGNLGTQEAGLAFLVQSIGYNPALGVGISLLKRLRQIIWTAIGFTVWGMYRLLRSREHLGAV